MTRTLLRTLWLQTPTFLFPTQWRKWHLNLSWIASLRKHLCNVIWISCPGGHCLYVLSFSKVSLIRVTLSVVHLSCGTQLLYEVTGSIPLTFSRLLLLKTKRVQTTPSKETSLILFWKVKSGEVSTKHFYFCSMLWVSICGFVLFSLSFSSPAMHSESLTLNYEVYSHARLTFNSSNKISFSNTNLAVTSSRHQNQFRWLWFFLNNSKLKQKNHVFVFEVDVVEEVTKEVGMTQFSNFPTLTFNLSCHFLRNIPTWISFPKVSWIPLSTDFFCLVK